MITDEDLIRRKRNQDYNNDLTSSKEKSKTRNNKEYRNP
jgi:hypothetical protein